MLNFLKAILAAYRLAILITQDSGPLFIFQKFRYWTDEKAAEGQFTNLNEAIYCPYCVGVWAAFLCAILLQSKRIAAKMFIDAFAVAGGQTVLHQIFNEKSKD